MKSKTLHANPHAKELISQPPPILFMHAWHRRILHLIFDVLYVLSIVMDVLNPDTRIK